MLVLGAGRTRETAITGIAVTACMSLSSHARHAGGIWGLGLERLAEAAVVLGGGYGGGAPGGGAGGVVGVVEGGGVVHRCCLWSLREGCGMAGEVASVASLQQ